MFKHCGITSAALLCLLVAGNCASNAAADVWVEYYDKAGTSFPDSGGPLWTGFVNSTTDTLTIHTWTELYGHGQEFWTPVDLPMVWNAVDANGNRYDVPDTFGDEGVVDFGDDQDPINDFAFISPVSSQNMNWHPFVRVDDRSGYVDTSTIVNFTAAVEFFIGWGGYASRSGTGPIEYVVAQPNAESSANEYDYQTVPALPVSATDVLTSTSATITVLPPQASSVPEASAFLGVGLCGAGCAAASLRRGRRLAASQALLP